MRPYVGPVEVVAGTRRDVLLVCDHASNAIPPEFDALGLPPAEIARHIAFDPGAAEVTRALAALLDCAAILGGTSRLVTDLNRAPDDATLILAESDNTFVPANLEISDDERARRLAAYHAPYHARVTAEIDARLAAGIMPTFIAVHSFNPVLGSARPWPIGVLWKTAREPVAAIIDALAARGFNVGDNKPYDGRTHLGWTVDVHAISRGLPNVMFEIRNDEIATPDTQQQYAELLHDVLCETGFIAPSSRT